jgi:MoxR-like ATPase
MTMNEQTDMAPIATAFDNLRAAVGSVVVGQEEAIRLGFLTLLCSGHALIEGVPGVAKTLFVRTLARALRLRFGRVQFTPDLMPSDIVGTPVVNPATGEVHFRPGPLFTDVLLADEINRASAKTQAALLEAMQEAAATVDGVTHPLGEHFCVFATQNPVEQEGTYPLPEAELDRFLCKLIVGYPSVDDEIRILALHHAGTSRPESVEPVFDAAGLAQARALVARVVVRDEVLAYVAALVRATRADLHFALGASPRGGVMLLRAAKANAAIAGRDFVLPEDVQDLFLPVLRHRVQLDAGAEVEGLTTDEALRHTLQSVTVPR